MYTDILGYYVAASEDKVFTSTDGKYWTSYQNLTNITCGIYVSSTGLFFVGRPDGVYMSTDNVNWDKKFDIADVTAIHYSTIENLSGVTPRIYIGTQNYGLFYSVDGEIYQKIADIPNITHIVSTVAMSDGRSRILVFTDKDVYASEFGNDWEIVSQMCFVTGATFSNTFSKFYVSTNLGVFSSEFGENWIQCYNQTLSDNYETNIQVNTYTDLLTLRKGQVFQDSIVRVLDTNLLYQVIDDNRLLSDDFTPTENDNAFTQYFTYFDYYSTAIQGTENLLNDDAFNMVLVGTRSHGMYSTTDGYNFTYKSELNDVCDIQSFLFDSKLKVVNDTIDGYNARFTPLKDSVDGGNASMRIQDDIDGYNAKNNDTKQYIIVCTLEGIYYTDDTDFWQQGANTRYGQSLEAVKVIDEENNRIEAVVPQEQFSIAIGRRGQNVKLAAQLLGCDIDVLTEEQEQERRSNENKVRSQRFMEALDVDEMIAHLLIAEGFSNVDEIAMVELSELSEIEGFDEDVAKELQSRAKEYVEKRDREFAEKSKALGLDEKLQSIEGLDRDMLLTLAGKGIKTIDDLADLAADELIELLGEDVISIQEANRIIMAARQHWFDAEEQENAEEK